MAVHPISGSDSSLSEISTGRAEAQSDPNDAPSLHETDLADLAARFSASTGASLSPELSTDLALEIVLHEIVEQACLATGATGAAIVLERDGELVCRASSGPTAPELGARLDGYSGLSGECLRTRQLQRSADAQADPRADVEASRWLGVRSVLVYPLLDGNKVLGVFEAFSSKAGAFGERDERTLEVLVDRVLKNLRRAAEPVPGSSEEITPGPLSSHVLFEDFREPEPSRRGLDIAVWAMAVVILACAGILGLRLYRGVVPRSARRAQPLVSHAPSALDASVTRASIPVPAPEPVAKTAPRSTVVKAEPDASSDGDLRIYQNGREVFRLPADRSSATRQPGEPERVLQLTPDAAESALIHRVDPDYPEKAREQGIQGTVTLDTRIGPSGEVKEVRVVNGEPVLADAAVAAVRQWRFKPSRIEGATAEMKTTITLNFRLPQ